MPGDKSVSHRALILGALAVGETRITGLLEGEDVLDTGRAMRAFGADGRAASAPGEWRVEGVGVGGFREPEDVIDHGNSGTGVRLVMGAMATTDITATFTGDASLRGAADGADHRPAGAVRRRGARPARRAAADHADRRGEPDAGAVHDAGALGAGEVGGAARRAERARRDGGDREGADARPYRADARRASAPTVAHRGHAEGRVITLRGQPELRPQAIAVPRDPSSAAFPVAAALLVEGSEVPLPGIGLNPTRAGLYETLVEMGADIGFANRREEGGEPVADLRGALLGAAGASRCRRSGRRR